MNVDRFKMVQEQQALTLRDLDDLTKRNRDLYERFTAVDIECSRVSEDLIAANGQIDQLRNECANLRAEKRIWEVNFFYHHSDTMALACADLLAECGVPSCRRE
jgi:predicted nuclease with TOPRIM domain